jgi:uncharacterized protein YndB with AHSA1/START domain
MNYSTSFSVDRTPEEVFAAVTNVRGWWSGDIEGDTDTLGAVFTYRHRDMHRSTQRITEIVPNKKVVWEISNSHLSFVKDTSEWDGSKVVFEICVNGENTELRFTHVGLTPEGECYEDCSTAWSFYVNNSLRNLITTGIGDPNSKEHTSAA